MTENVSIEVNSFSERNDDSYFENPIRKDTAKEIDKQTGKDTGNLSKLKSTKHVTTDILKQYSLNDIINLGGNLRRKDTFDPDSDSQRQRKMEKRRTYNFRKQTVTDLTKQTFCEKFVNAHHKEVGQINKMIFNNKILHQANIYENAKHIEYLFNKIKAIGLFQFYFSFISLLSGFAQVELEINGAYNVYQKYIEWFCFFSSIFLWISLYFEFNIENQLQANVELMPLELFKNDIKRICFFIVKLILFIPHPNPAFNGLIYKEYVHVFNFTQKIPINAILFLFCLSRFWFFFKLLVLFSNYSNPRSARACKMNKFRIDYSFYVKTLIDEIPFYLYSLVLILSILIFSYAIRIFERGLDEVSENNFSNIYNCVWFIIITMTTVGFGDLTPLSTTGRFIGILSCFLGIFLMSMLVVTITFILNLAPHENNVWLILERLDAEKEKNSSLSNILSKYIKSIIKFKNQREKSGSMDMMQMNKQKIDFFYEYNKYKDSNQNFERLFPPYGIYDNIRKTLTSTDEQLKSIETEQNEMIETMNESLKNYNISIISSSSDD